MFGSGTDKRTMTPLPPEGTETGLAMFQSTADCERAKGNASWPHLVKFPVA